jgi:RHS repeat-associated protein
MGAEPLAESDLSGNISEEYVFFGGKRVARRVVSSGTVFYSLGDHLGTSRVIVQASQTTACYEADYLPYGKERVITDTCPQNYKFTGKERDSESGLDYFGARYYAWTLGRFQSPDPVPGKVINPQSWNRYTYFLNNPLFYIDPDGAQEMSANTRFGTVVLGSWESVYAQNPVLDFFEALLGRPAAKAIRAHKPRPVRGVSRSNPWPQGNYGLYLQQMFAADSSSGSVLSDTVTYSLAGRQQFGLFVHFHETTVNYLYRDPVTEGLQTGSYQKTVASISLSADSGFVPGGNGEIAYGLGGFGPNPVLSISFDFSKLSNQQLQALKESAEEKGYDLLRYEISVEQGHRRLREEAKRKRHAKQE